MKRFKHLAIQTKVTLVILLTCGAALAVAAVAIFGAQMFTFKKQFTRDMSALGQIIGHNSTAALTFNDPKVAADILSALRAHPHIVQATILLPDGKGFAQYRATTNAELVAIAPQDGFQFIGRHLALVQPIVLDGERLGTLQLVADYRAELLGVLRVYGPILAAVLLGSIALAFLLSSRMQRVISHPILSLADMARKVAQDKNYSVRALKFSDDELGVLTEAFNRMLGEIQSHDAVLRESEERFRQLAENISEVFWMTDVAKKQMAYISPAYETIWGRTCKALYASPREWMDALHPDDRERIVKAAETKQSRGKYDEQYRIVRPDGTVRWIQDRAFPIQDAQGQVYRVVGIAEDITARKQAEAEMERLHRQFATASRQAGMAEVATGVLHNVGNVLNSVNVSATLVCDRIRQSKLGNLAKASAMLDGRNGDLAAFLTEDPKGRVLPAYLHAGLDQLQKEQTDMLQELNALNENIEHIKQVVSMQQSYSRVSGVNETLALDQLVEDALRINAAALQRHQVQILRQFAPVPLISVDRHKVLQILINLLSNAKYAMDKMNTVDRRLELIIGSGESGRVTITVRDHGMGIAPENLTRIFQHGFTTRSEGHGFGLHSSANAAREMGGRLTAHSEGVGHGASFTLELPAVGAAPVERHT